MHDRPQTQTTATSELERAREIARRRELALERALETMSVLRHGHLALKAENRELARELQRLRGEAA
jgi:hypothetical protein